MFRIHRPSRSIHGYYDWDHLFETFLQHVRPSDRVLEIGASTAARTAMLAAHCARVFGVELMTERIPAATEKSHFEQGDWESLAQVVAPGSIDVAVASHVIEHVPDDTRALNQLFDVLRPGGVAIINTPNRKRLVRSIIEFFGQERQFPWWEHVREYTESDLEQLLTRSKFEGWLIEGVAFGLHGGPIFCYSESVPRFARQFSNFWEVVLLKGTGPPQ